MAWREEWWEGQKWKGGAKTMKKGKRKRKWRTRRTDEDDGHMFGFILLSYNFPLQLLVSIHYLLTLFYILYKHAILWALQCHLLLTLVQVCVQHLGQHPNLHQTKENRFHTKTSTGGHQDIRERSLPWTGTLTRTGHINQSGTEVTTLPPCMWQQCQRNSEEFSLRTSDPPVTTGSSQGQNPETQAE